MSNYEDRAPQTIGESKKTFVIDTENIVEPVAVVLDSTDETELIPADEDYNLDVFELQAFNRSNSPTTLFLRSELGGAVRKTIPIAPNYGGVPLKFEPALEQETKNNKWTGELSDAVTDVVVNIRARKRLVE